MKCPDCDFGGTVVLATRQQDGRVIRSRSCSACGKRWTTGEVNLEELKLLDKIKANATALAQSVMLASGAPSHG